MVTRFGEFDSPSSDLYIVYVERTLYRCVLVNTWYVHIKDSYKYNTGEFVKSINIETYTDIL
jgi:hypothetical protein